MIKYTTAAFNKVKNDVKKLSQILGGAVPVFSIAYLLYAIFAHTGILIVNIVACILSVVYLILYIVYCVRSDGAERSEEKRLKRAQLKTKRAYKMSKILVNAVSLGISIYGIYYTAENVTPISVALVGLLLVFWILNVLVTLAYEFIRERVQLLIDGIQYDIESINPVKAVKDAVHRFQGREVEVDTDKISRKHRDLLDDLAEKDAEQKQKTKSENESSIKRFIKRVLGTEDKNEYKQ